MKRTIIFLILVALVAGGAAFYTKYLGAEPTSSYRTAVVKRGDLQININATGTLEPEEIVDVGAQIVGPILRLGDDPRAATDPAFKDKHIDYGSPVEDGTVLAVIDPAVYKAQRDQAGSSLLRAQADLGQLIAKRNQAEADWKRAQTLRNIKLRNLSPTGTNLNATAEPIKAISDSDYDLARANYEVAKANVEVGNATIAQAKDTLQLAETNLSYTLIKSPVKGTIVTRRVDVGQTVVATFSAQSLFLIAKDLSQLEIWASVNEADIGRIHLGMPVSFQVQAFPNDTFHGNVAQIRLNAQSNQNVVTYTVVVNTDNADLKLLPYLTADPVRFEVEKHTDVLLVPNAALRWQPRPEQIAPDARESMKDPDKDADTDRNEKSAGAGATDDGKGKAAKGGGRGGRRAKEREDRGTLWLKDGNYVRPLEVQKGSNDDQLTEISADDVKEGLEVVIGEIRAGADQPEETNPFAPRFIRRGGGGGGGGGKGGK